MISCLGAFGESRDKEALCNTKGQYLRNMYLSDNRTIIHMDLDSFFVSVEVLRDSRLQGRPLIIGGSSNRGVVASCSYEARHFGIRSAMPVALARQLCPDVTIISGDMEAYSQYSHTVTDIIAESSPLFEKASIDEFYIDASGMDRFFGTYKWASELRQRIMKESGLPISMGVSVNKLVSKVATGESKPNGQFQVQRGEERDYLAPFPVQKLPSVGEQTATFLHDMGIRIVRTLREMPVELLENAFGKQGVALWRKANAIDPSPVEAYSERKSISTELTFDADTIDVHRLRTLLVAMVEKVTYKLRQERKLTGCITVKLRYSNFDTVTRQIHLPYTSSDQTLIHHATALFEKLYDRRLLVRLVGVRLSKLVHGNYQISLFEDTEEQIRLYQAMDHIKDRFGSKAISRAASLHLHERLREDTNVFTGK